MNKEDNKIRCSLNSVGKIDKIRSCEEKMTFKDSAYYLWSFITLGVNWMIYKKLVLIVLIALGLAGSLVLSPHLGVILCILTPIFLAIYGKQLYSKSSTEYSKVDDNEKRRMLMPSSLLITWGLLIITAIILLEMMVDAII